MKETDRLQSVVDFRALNSITNRSNTPRHRTDEMLDRLNPAGYFSVIDLKTGLHQIRGRPENVKMTTFNTRYEKYDFLVMHGAS